LKWLTFSGVIVIVRETVNERKEPLNGQHQAGLLAEPEAAEPDERLLKRVLYGPSCRNYQAAAASLPGAP